MAREETARATIRISHRPACVNGANKDTGRLNRTHAMSAATAILALDRFRLERVALIISQTPYPKRPKARIEVSKAGGRPARAATCLGSKSRNAAEQTENSALPSSARRTGAE